MTFAAKHSKIRRAEEEDVSRIVAIWLAGSIQAHDFIPGDFWQAHTDALLDVYLPHAETLVLEWRGEIVAFSVLQKEHLEALFTHPSHQRRGLGSELLNFVKTLRGALTSRVYLHNEGLVRFYRNAGFYVVEDSEDPVTGAQEALMRWERNGLMSPRMI